MGNHSSLLLREEEIETIQQETGFTPNQIERLYSRFTSLDKGDNGFLCREDFHRIPELAINPLGTVKINVLQAHSDLKHAVFSSGDRIVNAFFCESGSEDQLNFRQFMKVLAHFRPVKKDKENKLNSREGKLRFAFQMYDTDNDEQISKEELLGVLQMMVGDNIR